MLGEGMSRDYPKRSYTSPDRMGAFVGVKEGGYTCDLSDIRLGQVQTFDEYAPSGVLEAYSLSLSLDALDGY